MAHQPGLFARLKHWIGVDQPSQEQLIGRLMLILARLSDSTLSYLADALQAQASTQTGFGLATSQLPREPWRRIMLILPHCHQAFLKRLTDRLVAFVGHDQPIGPLLEEILGPSPDPPSQ